MMSELDKRMMRTPDLNRERLETLKRLLPDLFTIEGKLNPEELQKIVDPELAREAERFEFRWFGKSQAKRNAFTPSKAALVYDEARSVNPEYADGNMIIEGENLETMKCLLSAYREKVKLIYIDPPYNTGNDFIYRDNWDETRGEYWENNGMTENGVKLESNPESSGRFHSNWLNMIYPRLLLARQLLRPDGVIFISIDDNEENHLRYVCDEVFGIENRIDRGMIVWLNRGSTKGFTKIVKNNEYILCYAKQIENLKSEYGYNYNESLEDICERLHIQRTEKNPVDRILFPKGLKIEGGGNREFREAIGKGDNRIDIINGPLVFCNGKLDKEAILEASWPYKDQMIKFFDSIGTNKEIYDTKGQKWLDVYFTSSGVPYYRKKRLHKILSSILDGVGNSGFSDLGELGLQRVFNNAKPVALVKELVKYFTRFDDNSIVFDFFSGSGTTAQAIIELNKCRGGNRRFILVQLPEMTTKDSEQKSLQAGYRTISDIAIERSRRVIERMEHKEHKERSQRLAAGEAEAEAEAGRQLSLPGGGRGAGKKPFRSGFKVYRLARSNFPRVEFAPDAAKTMQENLALLDQYIEKKEAALNIVFNESEVLDEVLLKNGFMLSYSKEREERFPDNALYRVKDGFRECLICMDMELRQSTIEILKECRNTVYRDMLFICLARALDTTAKWNVRHLLGDRLIAF